jgi:hypothetical protein
LGYSPSNPVMGEGWGDGRGAVQSPGGIWSAHSTPRQKHGESLV